MLTNMGIERAYTGSQSGGNMEGKEVRFGNPMTALFATVTTDASCGAVIGMHDSFTPIGGLVPLFNIQTDEVIFGGRRRRSLQHVALCSRRCLHRRPDGRAHARICGQEDRAKRSQDGHYRDPCDRFVHPCIHSHQLSSSICEGSATGIRLDLRLQI